MTNGEGIGFLVLLLVITGYWVAIARSNWGLFWGTLIVSCAALALVLGEVHRQVMGWDAAYALFFMGLFVWLPVFAIAALVSAFWIAARRNRRLP